MSPKKPWASDLLDLLLRQLGIFCCAEAHDLAQRFYGDLAAAAAFPKLLRLHQVLGDAARNAAVTAETAVPKFRFGTSNEVWDRDLLLKPLEVNWDHLLSGMEDSCQIMPNHQPRLDQCTHCYKNRHRINT